MSDFQVVWPQGRKVFSDGDTVERVGDLSGKTSAAKAILQLLRFGVRPALLAPSSKVSQ